MECEPEEFIIASISLINIKLGIYPKDINEFIKNARKKAKELNKQREMK